MSKSHVASFLLLFVLTFSLFALLGAALPPAVTAEADAEREVYIVELSAPALALVAGRWERGAGADPALAAERERREAARRDFLSRAERETGRPLAPLHTYEVTLNGMALPLTAAEARRVTRLPGVRAVHPPAVYHPLSDAGPDFIEADLVWDGSGTGGLPGTRGEGVVIGVIDTGLDYDHPAFAAQGPVDGYVHTNPWGTYVGVCATDPSICNDKLIGYWDFSGDGVDATSNSHGTNVASIAAANVFTVAYGGASATITPTLSGVAPHANLVAYDACAGNSCTNYMLLAAIEQATIDGVDVINYSIGDRTMDPWRNPITRAFLGARAAGVFVAAAAGNGSNPGTISAGADAPWLTAVGNLRHDRIYATSIVSFSGGGTPPAAPLMGNGFSAGYGPAPVVMAGDYDPANAQCQSAFAPGTFSDVDGSGTPAIVVCESGGVAFHRKENHVAAGGAGGMIGLSDSYWIYDTNLALPATTLYPEDSDAVRAWMSAGAGHQAMLAGPERVVDAAYGDHIYAGSSRGPNVSVPDVIKPDVAAPGYVIYGAINGGVGRYIGTSQASPHVAGAAALLRAIQPGWSPAQMQSALMATAVYSTVTDGWIAPAGPFDTGAGRIDVARAARAGLLLDESASGYLAANPAHGGDPAQINLPSLGNGACVGGCSWSRTVENARAVTTTWDVVMEEPAGITLTVTPATLELGPGAAATFTVTAQVDDAAETWHFGAVRWAERDALAPETRLPLAVHPAPLDVPAEVHVAVRRDAGSVLLEGLRAPAVDGLQVAVGGPIAAQRHTVQLAADPTLADPYDDLADAGTLFVTETVPAGAAGFVAEVLESASFDLDLYVGRDANGDGLPAADEEVCVSRLSSWTERCRLDEPEAGVYWVVVQNIDASPAAPDQVTVAVGVVPAETEGMLQVSGPGSVPAGEPFDLRLQWQDATGVGAVYFAVMDLGTGPAQPEDLGRIWIRLERLPDDVTRTLSATELTLGRQVTVTVEIAPNTLWDDTAYAVTATVPALLRVLTGTVSGGATADGARVTWQGTMPAYGAASHVISYVAAVDPAVCRQPADPLSGLLLLEHATDTPGSVLVSSGITVSVHDLAQSCAPHVQLVLTVSNDGSCGTTDMLFSPEPAEVTYCYTLENSSPVTVTHHTLTDTVLGPLFSDEEVTVSPGGVTVFTTTVPVTRSVSHVATWVAAVGPAGPAATAQATARVQIGYALYLPVVARPE